MVYTPETLPGPAINAAPPCGDRTRLYIWRSRRNHRFTVVRHAFGQHAAANARDLVTDWRHGPETVLLSLSPLSHPSPGSGSPSGW